MIDLASKIREIPDFPIPGILFRDITPLLRDPAAFRAAIDQLHDRVRGLRIDVVVGMESRGFIFAAPLAYLLGAGLVPIRKLGKLPAETVSAEYDLEYGTNSVEMHRDAISPDQRVLVVDDLIATGGTVEATLSLVRRVRGEVVACLFLIELLELSGRARVDGERVISLLTY